MLDKSKKERISHVVIGVLYSRFKNFPEDATNNRNAPFHTAFLNAFNDKFQGKVTDIPYFITMSSWLQGLNTTLGQTFFEKTAQILANGEKREFTSGRNNLLKITKKQSSKIEEIMSDLYNSVHKPDIEREESLLYSLDDGEEVNATGFTADVYYETEDEIIAIEMKSVKPNSGEMRGEKKKILEGKAALKHKCPDKKIKFFIGFPFDPTGNGVEYDKERFAGTVINLTKSFANDEILLGDELWDKLSGTDKTMQQLLDIINIIATPQFKDDFDYINNSQNRNTKRYREILSSWNLFSELTIIENIENLTNKAKSNNTLQRLLNKNIFDSYGIYTIDRFIDINKLI